MCKCMGTCMCSFTWWRLLVGTGEGKQMPSMDGLLRVVNLKWAKIKGIGGSYTYEGYYLSLPPSLPSSSLPLSLPPSPCVPLSHSWLNLEATHCWHGNSVTKPQSAQKNNDYTKFHYIHTAAAVVTKNRHKDCMGIQKLIIISSKKQWLYQIPLHPLEQLLLSQKTATKRWKLNDWFKTELAQTPPLQSREAPGVTGNFSSLDYKKKWNLSLSSPSCSAPTKTLKYKL